MKKILVSAFALFMQTACSGSSIESIASSPTVSMEMFQDRVLLDDPVNGLYIGLDESGSNALAAMHSSVLAEKIKYINSDYSISDAISNYSLDCANENAQVAFTGKQRVFFSQNAICDSEGKTLWKTDSFAGQVSVFYKQQQPYFVVMESYVPKKKLSILDSAGKTLKQFSFDALPINNGQGYQTVEKLTLLLDENFNLKNIALTINNGVSQETGAMIFDENLIQIKSFRFAENRYVQPIIWPDKKLNFYIDGDLSGANVLVKSFDNLDLFKNTINSISCSFFRHSKATTVWFDGVDPYLVLSNTGDSACRHTLVSIFNTKRELIWQKEYGVAASITPFKNKTGKNVLLLAGENGLIEISKEWDVTVRDSPHKAESRNP